MTTPIEITYGPHARQTFDWYVGTRLCVFAIHGGGWVEGDKRGYAQLPAYVLAFLTRGWAVANINYRFSADASWPAQLDDAIACLDRVRELAGVPIVLFGESSGGHLALELLAARTGIAAHAELYPPTDLVTIAGDAPEFPLWSTWLAALLRGVNPASASPSRHVRPQSPPGLLMHGTADTIVPFAQSTRYVEAAGLAGNACTLLQVSGAIHGSAEWSAAAHVANVVGFFGGFETLPPAVSIQDHTLPSLAGSPRVTKTIDLPQGSTVLGIHQGSLIVRGDTSRPFVARSFAAVRSGIPLTVAEQAARYLGTSSGYASAGGVEIFHIFEL